MIKGFPFSEKKPLVFSIEYEAHETDVDRILRENGYDFIYALYRPVNKNHRAIFWNIWTLPILKMGFGAISSRCSNNTWNSSGKWPGFPELW